MVIFNVDLLMQRKYQDISRITRRWRMRSLIKGTLHHLTNTKLKEVEDGVLLSLSAWLSW
jgi:hypothetical protein